MPDSPSPSWLRVTSQCDKPIMSSSLSLITAFPCPGRGRSPEALEVSLRIDMTPLISALWGQQINPPHYMATRPCWAISSQGHCQRSCCLPQWRSDTRDTVSFSQTGDCVQERGVICSPAIGAQPFPLCLSPFLPSSR